MRQTQSPERKAVVVALVLGGVAGALDLAADSPQVASTAIVIFTFVLGLTYPRKAWWWALAVGIGVPLANTLVVALGYPHFRRPENIYLTYLAFFPAFIGAYIATGLRWMAARQEQKRRQASKS